MPALVILALMCTYAMYVGYIPVEWGVGEKKSQLIDNLNKFNFNLDWRGRLLDLAPHGSRWRSKLNVNFGNVQ